MTPDSGNVETSSRVRGAATQPLLCLLLVVAITTGCGGRSSDTDPLASIAAAVNDEDRLPAPLVESWNRRPAAPLTLAPAVGRDNVYLGLGNRVFSWRAFDGEPVGFVELSSDISAAPVVAGDALVVGTEQTAEAKARIWWISPQGDIADSRIVEHAAREIRAASDMVVYLDEQGINALIPGAPWTTPIADARTVDVSSDGAVVYVTTTSGSLRAFGARDGRELWAFEKPEETLTRPAHGDGRVYVGSSGGEIIALDATDGKEIWERRLGTAVIGAPVVVAEHVWVAGLDARLRALHAGNGTEVFTSTLSSRNYLDMTSFEAWAIVGPRYGPWAMVRAPGRADRSAAPILMRVRQTNANTPDLALPAATGIAGVAVVNGDGTVSFMQPRRTR